MNFKRAAAGVAVLVGLTASLAAGADLTYSGVPRKWKKTAKVDKGNNEVKNTDKKVEEKDPGTEKEKGKRTLIIPAPTVTVTPGSGSSEKK